ncbi:SUMO-specific isopeptidase USPL1 [Caerostris darwini]|uniref:SUMO-specific isopeptidase USPL1 n=1 Tax=Caerostris darwini TaxID=1538125 RepID=A0AAV4RY45_9ARAC|nr:SUMO-specific isopeptidase USPL1 [Caerostris darwini]
MKDHSKENNAADTDGQGIPCSDSETKEFNQSSVKDNILSRSYINWENVTNLCWLDSSMSLVVHNQTLCRTAKKDGTQIAGIIKHFEQAISLVNDFYSEDCIEKRIKEARSLLRTIQISTLNYLKPILKCSEGEPDSAFCSLLNLISQDEQLKNLFTVEYSWIRKCETCTTPIVRNYKKTIITLSRVRSFFPCSPISLCTCPVCKSPDQIVHLEYITLPQCFIFHFENGAGKGEFQTTAMDFEIKNRKYRLSGLITLDHSKDAAMNHFVTWIRDKDTECWLECNDLNSDVVIFDPKPLVIDLTKIYIFMYEALDDKGTIRNKILDTNSIVTAENAWDIPLIDISEEDSLKCQTGVESEKCFSISQKNELEKTSKKVTALENAHEENIKKNLKDQSCIIQNNIVTLSFADCFDIEESPFSLKNENIIMQDFSSRSLDSKNDSENVLCEYSSIEDQSEKMTTAISQNNPNYNLTNPVLESDATFVKEIMPVKECCLKDSIFNSQTSSTFKDCIQDVNKTENCPSMCIKSFTCTSGEIKTKKNNLNKVSSKKIASTLTKEKTTSPSIVADIVLEADCAISSDSSFNNNLLVVSENENETSVNSPGKIVCRPEKAETSQILENRTSVEIFSIDSKTNQPSEDLVPETIASCIETSNWLDIQEEIMHGSNALSEKKLIHRMNSEDKKKVENSDLEKCESYEKKPLKDATGASESEKAIPISILQRLPSQLITASLSESNSLNVNSKEEQKQIVNNDKSDYNVSEIKIVHTPKKIETSQIWESKTSADILSIDCKTNQPSKDLVMETIASCVETSNSLDIQEEIDTEFKQRSNILSEKNLLSRMNSDDRKKVFKVNKKVENSNLEKCESYEKETLEDTAKTSESEKAIPFSISQQLPAQLVTGSLCESNNLNANSKEEQRQIMNNDKFDYKVSDIKIVKVNSLKPDTFFIPSQEEEIQEFSEENVEIPDSVSNQHAANNLFAIHVKNIKNSIEDDTNTNITNDITSEKFLMKTKEPSYFVKDLSILLTPLEHFASSPFYLVSQTADEMKLKPIESQKVTKDLDKEQKSVKANPIIVFGDIELPLKEVRIKIEKLSEAEIASYLHPDTSNLGEDKLGSQLSNSIEELTRTVVVKSSEYPDLRKINKNKAKVRKKAAAHLKKHQMIKASNVLNLDEMKLDRKSFATAQTRSCSSKKLIFNSTTTKNKKRSQSSETLSKDKQKDINDSNLSLHLKFESSENSFIGSPEMELNIKGLSRKHCDKLPDQHLQISGTDQECIKNQETCTGSNKNASKCNSDDQPVMCGKRKKTRQSAKCCKRKKNDNQSVEKSMSKKSNNNSTKCNKRKKSDQSVNGNKRKKIDDQLVPELSANGSKIQVFPRINMSASKKSIKECIKTESSNINSPSSKESTSDVGKTSLSSNLPEPCVAVTNQNLSLNDRIDKPHAEDILTRILGYSPEDDSNSPFQCIFSCPRKPMKTHSKSDTKSDDHLAKNQEHSQTINDKLEFERHIPNNQSNPTDAGSNSDSNCLRNSNNLQLVPKNSDRRKRSKNKHRCPPNHGCKKTIIFDLVNIVLNITIPQTVEYFVK